MSIIELSIIDLTFKLNNNTKENKIMYAGDKNKLEEIDMLLNSTSTFRMI